MYAKMCVTFYMNMIFGTYLSSKVMEWLQISIKVDGRIVRDTTLLYLVDVILSFLVNMGRAWPSFTCSPTLTFCRV